MKFSDEEKRKLFESWYVTKYKFLSSYVFNRLYNGQYYFRTVQERFELWCEGFDMALKLTKHED